MFDLRDILKAVEAKEKTERKDALLKVAEEHINWTYDDKTKVVANIGLTRYQLHWLMWRIRVHLRSYNQMEWSEMKDVLTQILAMLEGEWEKCSTSATTVDETSPITHRTMPVASV